MNESKQWINQINQINQSARSLFVHRLVHSVPTTPSSLSSYFSCLLNPDVYVYERNVNCDDVCYFITQTPASPRTISSDFSLSVPKGMFRTPTPSPPPSKQPSPCQSPQQTTSPLADNSPETSQHGATITVSASFRSLAIDESRFQLKRNRHIHTTIHQLSHEQDDNEHNIYTATMYKYYFRAITRPIICVELTWMA